MADETLHTDFCGGDPGHSGACPDPTCGATLAHAFSIDHPDDHECTLSPDHPHIRNHVCHCGYVWPRVNSPTTTRATAPTATQLYNAVKELRAANGHRVLTIPEINSVLVARAEYAAGVAAGPQATPGPSAEDGAISILRRLAITDDLWEWDIDTPPKSDVPHWVRTDRESRAWEWFAKLTDAEQAAWRVVAVPTDHEDRD